MDDDRIRRDLLRQAWEMTVTATLTGSGGGSVSPAAAMGVLQHYGFRSWFVAITDDEMVALWFARTKPFMTSAKMPETLSPARPRAR